MPDEAAMFGKAKEMISRGRPSEATAVLHSIVRTRSGSREPTEEIVQMAETGVCMGPLLVGPLIDAEQHREITTDLQKRLNALEVARASWQVERAELTRALRTTREEGRRGRGHARSREPIPPR